MSLGFWGSASSRRKRIIVVLMFFVFAILVTVVGVLTPLTTEQVNQENNQLTNLQQDIRQMDILHQTASIFENNFQICLLMFIPVVGIVFGSIAMFNTGSFIQAQIVANNASNHLNFPPILALLSLFIFPFTWLEYISYSTAFSESFWFIHRGLQGKLVKEIINLLKLILITAILLAAGAFIEALIITYAG